MASLARRERNPSSLIYPMKASLAAKNLIVSAKIAGLRYVTDRIPGIRRPGTKRSFRYIGPDGRVIRDAETLGRIRSLVVPPGFGKVLPKTRARVKWHRLRPGLPKEKVLAIICPAQPRSLVRQCRLESGCGCAETCALLLRSSGQTDRQRRPRLLPAPA
jgi:hypothetical protein